MANKERIVTEFMELVRIDSLTKNERNMADVLKKKLQGMGYTAVEDDAGTKTGGTAGNIICSIKGSKSVPAILLMAHMDTVVPGIGKKPILEDGYIRTDGTTVLGGDDAAGIECILEALRIITEEKRAFGDIQVVFTIAEEGGLFGAKNLDYGRIYAKYGVVLDASGPIGTIAVKAPSQNKISVTVKGKAAHAGIEPEKGVSAIQIASEAISNMKLGRIDNETTANIGIIKGGLATNIICDKVEIDGEARSRCQKKLDEQTLHMQQCFEKAAEKYNGSIECKSELEYPSFQVNEDSDIVGILKKASTAAGIELKLEGTGGGSDTNIISGKGIQAVNMSIAMDKVHSVEEQILVDDMVKAADFLVAIIENVS